MEPPLVDVELVRALLREQHPDLAAQRVAALATGWDNALFRLGDDLTVRLPRRVEGAALIEHEHRWLPTLVAGLPPDLATSAPLRTGRPGCGYPWAWSIGPWHPGEVAAVAPPTDPADAARRLGAFLAAFHRPAPPDAPVNPFRGIPLPARGERLLAALDEVEAIGRHLGPGVTRGAVLARWADLVDVTAWPGPPQWLHGDLHPANLLVHEGRLLAVIDFGDLTSGDPATDFAVAWLLLPASARATFRAAAGAGHPIDDATWARAEGWALALAVSYLAGPATQPPLESVAHRALAEITAAARPPG